MADRNPTNDRAGVLTVRQARKSTRRGVGYRVLAVFTACVLAFMYIPIATVIVFSFNSSKVMRLPLTGWTFDWYAKAFTNPQLLAALSNSLIVGAAAVVICLAIGVPTALALNNFDFPGKTVVRRLAILPITLPGLITGVSILSFFSQSGVQLSLFTVIVGHGTALTAVVITSVFARLQRFDQRIAEASGDLGAGPLRTFWHVTLPNIRTAIIGSSLLAFTLSFDEIPVTFFLTGRDNTLPMYIWSTLRRGITPEINAIGTVIILVSLVLILISVALMTATETDSTR
jgi:spermidine/putrescine transport system permease protein